MSLKDAHDEEYTHFPVSKATERKARTLWGDALAKSTERNEVREKLREQVSKMLRIEKEE